MQTFPPENRALTVGVCKRLGIWPLDRKHRAQGDCCCPSCFGGVATPPPDELSHLRAKRTRVALPWEEDAA